MQRWRFNLYIQASVYCSHEMALYLIRCHKAEGSLFALFSIYFIDIFCVKRENKTIRIVLPTYPFSKSYLYDAHDSSQTPSRTVLCLSLIILLLFIFLHKVKSYWRRMDDLRWEIKPSCGI